MRKKAREGLLILADIVIINISTILAYILQYDGQITKIPLDFLNSIAIVLFIATTIKESCFLCFKLYNSLWRYAGIEEMVSVFAAVFISNTAIIVVAVILHLNVPLSIFVISFFIDNILIGGIRFAYRLCRRIMRLGIANINDFKKILIIGGGEAGAIIINELRSNPQLKSRPVAVIDDDRFKIGKKINGVIIAGNRYEIVNVVNKYKIDEIIIAIPSASKVEINKIYTECSKTSCRIKILPSVCQLINGNVSIQKIRDVNLEDLLGREVINLDTEGISTYLKDRAVLVTGGGGSIGSELCRQIACYKPKQLIILDNYENNAYEIQNELFWRHPGLNLITVIANIREKERMESVFRKYKPEIVFHAAAHKHVPLMEINPTEAIKNNVFGTQNVVECSDKYEVKKFVLISTDKAVNPTNIMGATKRVAEMIVQSYNRYSKTEFVAVRFGNVLGSNGSVIPIFKKQIEQGGPVTVTHPEVTRYFMTIPEAAQLVIQAGAMAKGGEIFVLDMGQPVKIYDLARNLIKLSGLEPEVDIEIKFTGLRPGEKLFEELLLAEEGLQATVNNKIYAVKPIFTDLAIMKREMDILLNTIVSNSEEVEGYMQRIVPTYKKAL